MAKKKPTIDDYKDRLSAPVGAKRIDVKTKQAAKKTTKRK